jgi:L-alanine-DL-glutamate epimerase-like enolase superfamily enzyme
MGKVTDVAVRAASLRFLPVQTRVPLKFGSETLTEVTCARVCVRVEDRRGRSASGWGETPLSVQWVWPSALSYQQRHQALQDLCVRLVPEWCGGGQIGHPLEIGHAFIQDRLPGVLAQVNAGRAEPMPWLAALVCCSAFDLAVHDAYGMLLDRDTYATYDAEFMNQDLAAYLRPAPGADVDFRGQYPAAYLEARRPETLPAWHLVGGKDLLDAGELTGGEPRDGYPVLLADWVARDGLACLKVKLRGDDAEWDFDRLVRVGHIGLAGGADWLSADFNCTVTEPGYVNAILDRLVRQQPRLYGMILYVEQPFPYDLERHRIDVHSVSARKPLFMDESAHDWQLVGLGRQLGWTGVALKTCKTQTGALLSLCWAKAHGMTLMVQDLTNPMLAQIPHLLLAAHAGTIMGVETNSMQFYPEASRPEQAVHPGLYQRRDGRVDLRSLTGPGFGYQIARIDRRLPDPAAAA